MWLRGYDEDEDGDEDACGRTTIETELPIFYNWCLSQNHGFGNFRAGWYIGSRLMKLMRSALGRHTYHRIMHELVAS